MSTEFGKGTSYYTFPSPSITNHRLWRYQISQVTAREYAIGSQIQRKDSQHIRQFRWRLFSLMTTWLVMHFTDNFHPRFMDATLTIILVMLFVFTVKIFFVDLPSYMQNMAK